jgi:two-component system, OmpR family, response regulator AdeR
MENLQGRKIIVAEDEPELAQMLSDFLQRAGATVLIARDGRSAIEEARRWSPDLVLLDIRMPIKDGLSVLVACREFDPQLLVIMVTALGDDVDKLTGFRLGADDYVVKPYNPLEVVARVQAVFRRRDQAAKTELSACHFTAGSLRLESNSRRVFADNKLLNLTPSEFRILESLISRQGRLLTRAALTEEILGEETSDRSIDAHISRLRAKISGIENVRITAVRGEGYRLDVTT